MTTPTGTITMLDVILELDGVATPREITLDDADVRALAEVPSGEISMDDLRGKSAIKIVVTGDITVGVNGGATTWGQNAIAGFGSVANVLGFNGWPANPSVNNISTTPPNDGAGISTPTDLSADMQFIRIFGSGRDDTIAMTSFNYAGGLSQCSNATGLMFGPADVGNTYQFEIFS